MSARVVRILDDDQTIIQRVCDMTVETTSQLRDAEWKEWKGRLRSVVSERLIAGRLEDGANDVMAAMMDLAARLGFFLAVTVASHGPLGDRIWLAEALRLAGEDVTVEVRQGER